MPQACTQQDLFSASLHKSDLAPSTERTIRFLAWFLTASSVVLPSQRSTSTLLPARQEPNRTERPRVSKSRKLNHLTQHSTLKMPNQNHSLLLQDASQLKSNKPSETRTTHFFGVAHNSTMQGRNQLLRPRWKLSWIWKHLRKWRRHSSLRL